MSVSSGLQIGPATAEDLSVLSHVFPRHVLLGDRLRRQHDDRGLLLVAWQDGVPVGLIYLWWEPAEEPELRKYLPDVPLLMHLEVHIGRRNAGIGSALVRAGESLLHRAGHRRVALGVRPSNGGAARLYRRLGYVNWPHGDIETSYETVNEAGEMVRGREMCQILTKELTG